MKFEGSKYNISKNWANSEICKAIKADLFKSMPKIKWSVSKDVYAGGWSICIKILASEVDLFKNEDEYFKLVKKYAEIIANAYCYDDSDSMIDYFNRRFYTHVGTKLTEADFDPNTIKAKKLAKVNAPKVKRIKVPTFKKTGYQKHEAIINGHAYRIVKSYSGWIAYRNENLIVTKPYHRFCNVKNAILDHEGFKKVRV